MRAEGPLSLTQAPASHPEDVHRHLDLTQTSTLEEQTPFHARSRRKGNERTRTATRWHRVQARGLQQRLSKPPLRRLRGHMGEGLQPGFSDPLTARV
ncbi:hypothetical protein NDU88_012985 [Pleurodeles waltl]|uniref:Uncharacterized protein n=1 Tax=Pleurodeles waltl TaxID=8319 RepID=A0AAV7R3E8_PLEWA|nr:hypothetical protein NDU88_012985 [Pleurodeles waltl]